MYMRCAGCSWDKGDNQEAGGGGDDFDDDFEGDGEGASDLWEGVKGFFDS